MTQSRELDRGEIVAAVATAEDSERSEVQGAVHTSTICEMIGASRNAIENHCQDMAGNGILTECYDLGPHGPRLCYRVADPSKSADDNPEVSVYG